jgi:hypothetical protein
MADLSQPLADFGQLVMPVWIAKEGASDMHKAGSGSESRFPETLRLLLQIRPRSSAGSSSMSSLVRVRFGLKVALMPPVE